MTAILITAAAACILSAMWIVVMAMHAPEGRQDSDGFHYTNDLDSEG